MIVLLLRLISIVLFTFFVLETILLSKFLKINPFDQPAVENIKKTTKNILLRI